MGLSVKVCKFIIYRHFMKSVNGPNFPVIISDGFEISMGTDVFCLGNYQGVIFRSLNFRSGVTVIFLKILC